MLIAAQIIGGLILLFGAGEILVKGAVSLAKAFSVPIVVISLTIVALGTSAPEMLVSIQAAINGHPDIVIGNIIGSNISNMAFILGISAIIFPIIIHQSLLRREIPILALVTVIFALFCFSGELTRLDGVVLLFCLVGYMWWMIRDTHKNKLSQAAVELVSEELEDTLSPEIGLGKAITYTVAGIILLAVGADLLIEGAVELATIFEVPQSYISVTLVAVGSSLPELATSAIAAWRKHGDIAVGNVVGSNLLNILFGISVPALIGPVKVNPAFLGLDIWLLLALTFFLVFYRKREITKPVGIALFFVYISYITYLTITL